MKKGRTKEQLQRILCNDGIADDVSEEYAQTLAYSSNRVITEAVDELLQNGGEQNVRFAGACNTFLLKFTYGLSYLQTLAFAEEVLSSMEYAAVCGEYIVIEKTDGSRIVFEPKVYDSDGEELLPERKEASVEAAANAFLVFLEALGNALE